MSDTITIGDKLDAALDALRLARPHVATIAGYTLGHWTNLERGQRIMEARLALRRIDEAMATR